MKSKSIHCEFDEVCARISGIWQEFDAQFLPCLTEASEAFFEKHFGFELFNISTAEKIKDVLPLKGESFFTSQVPALNVPPVTLRLNEAFARQNLHNILGSNSPQFKLSSLTELEIKILNSYLDFLHKNFSNLLIPNERLDKVRLKNKKVYHFTLLVKNENNQLSKIVLSLPASRLDFKPFERQENFTDENFINLTTSVDLIVGTSKITLNELKCISEGDIILLEESNVARMKINAAGIVEEFRVNPDPSLIIELDEDEHDIDLEEGEASTMWDDIQIEVNAQFQKVKMSLGDLKHISKGLVIDLGSVFNNEISLLVENKVVAKGELVIINDKYAVKVNDVVQEQAPTEKQPQKAPKKEVREKVQQTKEDEVEEDFDYSDFEEEK